MKTFIAKIILAVLALMLLPDMSHAIPAFARKYDMTCQTCHSPIPKLKPYGEEFMNNGYQIPDKEPPRFFRETGDDKLLLMRELPLAVRIDGFASFVKNGNSQLDLQSPFIAKLMSGGQIARDVSYYFYFLMSEGGTIVGPEDAFLLFRDAAGSGIDITVGQFQICDPLFKRELRLTREDYKIYNTPVGNSSATMTYDRGIMFGYMLPTKTTVILEILNGSGIGPKFPNGFLDNDNNKNFMLRVSQEVSQDVRFGAFGYLGMEEQNTRTNSSTIVGPDLTVNFSSLQLNAQYIHREDDNPNFTAAASTITLDGAFAELIYSPDGDKSDWYGVALYNWITSDTPGFEYQSATLSGNYMLARNVRLIGEYTYDIEAKVNKLSAGFVCAF